MDLFEIFTFAGIMGTFVGVGIAVAAYFNGKHIKATEGRVLALLESNSVTQREIEGRVLALLESNSALLESNGVAQREMREEMRLEREETKQWVGEMSRETREILFKMDQTLLKMDQKADARHQDVLVAVQRVS